MLDALEAMDVFGQAHLSQARPPSPPPLHVHVRVYVHLARSFVNLGYSWGISRWGGERTGQGTRLVRTCPRSKAVALASVMRGDFVEGLVGEEGLVGGDEHVRERQQAGEDVVVDDLGREVLEEEAAPLPRRRRGRGAEGPSLRAAMTPACRSGRRGWCSSASRRASRAQARAVDQVVGLGVSGQCSEMMSARPAARRARRTDAQRPRSRGSARRRAPAGRQPKPLQDPGQRSRRSCRCRRSPTVLPCRSKPEQAVEREVAVAHAVVGPVRACG